MDDPGCGIRQKKEIFLFYNEASLKEVPEDCFRTVKCPERGAF
jgi:hypothetical protein